MLMIFVLPLLVLGIALIPIAPFTLLIPRLRRRKVAALVLAYEAGALYFVSSLYAWSACEPPGPPAEWCHLAQPVLTAPLFLLHDLIYEHESYPATVYRLAFSYAGPFVAAVIPAAVLAALTFVGCSLLARALSGRGPRRG
jgi:hypothetical protein